jgi:phytanoyl-CoA hydroxylase
VGIRPEEVRCYHDRGVVIVPDLFDPADLEPLQAEIEEWIEARACALRDQGHLDDVCAAEPFERRYAELFARSQWIGAGLDVHLMRGPALFAFLRNDRLLDAVESLIGPEIALSPVHHLRAKLPQPLVPEQIETYLNVPWHQDSGVLWEEADPVPIVSAWIPLVDANAENGCMQAMPDAFRGGHLPHQAEGGTTILPTALPDIDAETLACPRGGAVFQNKFTPHRSTPNITSDVRWSLDVRYQPADLPSGRPFHPSFVLRSPRNRASEVHDWGAWNEAWRAALVALKDRPPPRAHRLAR